MRLFRSRRFWEVAGASGLVLWRVLWLAWPAPLTDWVVILAFYWAFTVFARETRAWAPVTVGTTALLLAIYLSQQLPLNLGIVFHGL